ncbi:unnamed protein product [Hermetia illucens]|uniref:Farnesol dehydrogenase n=1 Tax=Hermetia illucens TaxID=343691 RepID=A0A7R8UNS0_HERIL|nr:farnesol dehydrogenase [Hermetia illucens]CAD7084231.1 unnamed protein product [Hermetia illucens]
MDSNRWQDKVAVVTGASSGIGACIAQNLANSGLTVIGLARRVELIDDLSKNVSGNGKIYSRKCDLTNESEVQETFQWIKDNFSGIDVFVNNAGCIKAAFLLDSPTGDLKQLFDLNCVSTCVCVREAIRMMREKDDTGHIFIINSVLGHRVPDVPVPLFSVYPSTKHALTALCQTVRQEINFHKLNIKLTSISPGMVDTDLLAVYDLSMYAQLPKLQANDVAQAVMYALNTPDHVQIDDIVLQARFQHK